MSDATFLQVTTHRLPPSNDLACASSSSPRPSLSLFQTLTLFVFDSPPGGIARCAARDNLLRRLRRTQVSKSSVCR